MLRQYYVIVSRVLRVLYDCYVCVTWLSHAWYLSVLIVTLGLRDCLRHDVCLFWLPRKYSFVFVSSLPPVCYDCYISVTWLSRAWCVFVVTVTTVLRDCPTLFWFSRWYSLFCLAHASCLFKCLVDITLLSCFFFLGDDNVNFPFRLLQIPVPA